MLGKEFRGIDQDRALVLQDQTPVLNLKLDQSIGRIGGERVVAGGLFEAVEDAVAVGVGLEGGERGGGAGRENVARPEGVAFRLQFVGPFVGGYAEDAGKAALVGG